MDIVKTNVYSIVLCIHSKWKMFRKQRSQRFDSESMLNLSKLWLEDIKQLGVAHNAQLLYQLLIAKMALQRVV